MSTLQTWVILFVVVCFFACVFVCMLDVQDYREEFPDGDPNKGSEGSALIGGNVFSSTATHALR